MKMKKRIVMFLACLAATVNAFAQDNSCCPQDACCDDSSYNGCCTDCFGFDSVLTFGVGGGYRTDELQWNVFPSLTGLEVEEKWKNIQMGIVEADAQFLACEHYLLQVDFDYGWFNRSGHQTVNTFDLASDTLIESLRSRTKGRAYDLSGAIGYQFNFWCYRFSLAPLVGYSYHFQKFENNGYTNELVPVDETFAGTHNTYTFRWRGPFVGFTTAFQVTCDWQIYFSYAYHWARYRAKVNENFIVGSFPSHQKANNARGNEFTLGTAYEFCDNWLLGVRLDYKNFSSNKGSQEDDEGIIISNMRHLKWKTFSATLDLTYVF